MSSEIINFNTTFIMQKTILLFALCAIMSCSESNIEALCTAWEQNQTWTAENFKTDYTIQFPSTYKGDGASTSSNYYFNKYRKNKSVRFFWTHCGVAYCSEYGYLPLATLRDIITASSSEISNNGSHWVRNDLTEYKLFCDDSGVSAVFYYNTLPDADGALFLKLDDDQYYAAILVNYKNTEQQEVEDIMRTIQLE